MDKFEELNDAIYDICRQGEIFEDKYHHMNYALDSAADQGFKKFILDISKSTYNFDYDEFLDLINKIYEKKEEGKNYLNQIILYYPNVIHLAKVLIHTYDKVIEFNYPLIAWIQRISAVHCIQEMLLTLLAAHPMGTEILMTNEIDIPKFHPYAMITALVYNNESFVNLLINLYDAVEIRKALLLAIEIKNLPAELIPIDYHLFQQALWTGNENYLQKFIEQNQHFYVPMLLSSLSVFGYISLMEKIYSSIDTTHRDVPKYICRCNSQIDKDAADRLISEYGFYYVYSTSPIYLKNSKLNTLYEEWQKNNKILRYFFGHMLFANLTNDENIIYLLDGFYYD